MADKNVKIICGWSKGTDLNNLSIIAHIQNTYVNSLLILLSLSYAKHK